MQLKRPCMQRITLRLERVKGSEVFGLLGPGLAGGGSWVTGRCRHGPQASWKDFSLLLQVILLSVNL